jgi:hypothetical protein
MPPMDFFPRRSSSGKLLPPHAHSARRLALVACGVLVTLGALVLATFQARRAERALEQAGAQTLRDYTGYASRLLGAELLRRFADQRNFILAPVTGGSDRALPAPRLTEITERGEISFLAQHAAPGPARGYYRLDLGTGAFESTPPLAGPLATRIADTLRALAPRMRHPANPDVLVVTLDGRQYSVAYVPLRDVAGRELAIYGFTYTRSQRLAEIASVVFAQLPLLPNSFMGSRWNYEDSTVALKGELKNEAMLVARITDRQGHTMWRSREDAAPASSPYMSRAIISTAPGGIHVETALLPVAERLLVPAVARRAQRWSLTALVVLTAMLAAVSLLALRREREVSIARRAEAMQQLALGLRHELNNALASVMLNADLLQKEGAIDETQSDRLAVIAEQADRMRGVVRRLEQTDKLDVVVPYLDEGFMVDLSTPRHGIRDFRTDATEITDPTGGGHPRHATRSSSAAPARQRRDT